MLVPSPSSLALRESIADRLTHLRRVRPNVPYYKLAVHRIPTLWTLYRGLQRHAERENLKWRIRTFFEARRHTIQAHVAKAQLERAYQWLDLFVRAKQGNLHLQAVLDRYDRMIASKREKREFGRLVREAVEEQARLRIRTVAKGSFIRPTLYNKLLPWLVPQPVNISTMIDKRRLHRERRYEQSVQLTAWIQDLEMESAFERQLRRFGAHFEPVFCDSLNAWVHPLRDKLQIIYKANKNDYDRLYSNYPPSLLLRGVRARRRKVGYNTRLHARERAGEVFPSTLARLRQGPPAHIVAKMTSQERRMDKIAREPSEAGYSAAVKMNMGKSLKGKKLLQNMEDGREEWKRLKDMEEEIRKENRRRVASTRGELSA